MFQFISYFLFILISGYITIYVGWICYSNGYLFVLELFQNNEAVAKSLNQLLLIGYYLVNLGFILYGLHCWESIDNLVKMINLVSAKISTVLLSLCYLHFQNIIIIYLIRQYPNQTIIHFFNP